MIHMHILHTEVDIGQNLAPDLLIEVITCQHLALVLGHATEDDTCQPLPPVLQKSLCQYLGPVLHDETGQGLNLAP